MTRVHFIHTNDLHSHFDRWPHMVATIEDLKKELARQQEPYMLLDIGDHMDRSQMITEGTVGKANVDLLNRVGYDYVTIGNNEGITFSKEQLSEVYKQADFQVLVSNLYEGDGTRPSWLKSSYIHQLGPIQVGIVGATANFDLFYQLLGWKMGEATQCIAEEVNILRKEVDMIVILSHLGLPRDEKLAQSVPGIDLILGAHTHHVLRSGVQIGNTWINQAGRSGYFVGHVTAERKSKQWMMESTCINVSENKAHAETEKHLQKWKEKAGNELDDPVAHLENGLESAWFTESTFGNLLAEGLSNWCGTSMSVVNSGLLLGGLNKGRVTKQDLHRVCPHPINPCILTVTGEDIWAILKRSLDLEVQQFEIKGLGFRGKKMGMMSVDGMDIVYRKKGNESKEIISVRQGNEEIEPNRTYELATIDMFTFSPIFPELYLPENVHYFLPEFLRDVLAFRFSQGHIGKASRKRWIAIR